MGLAAVVVLSLVAPALGAEDFADSLLHVLAEFLREASTYSGERSPGSLPELRADSPLGELRAGGGYFRTGFRHLDRGLQVSIQPRNVSLTANFALADFEAGYTNCSLRVGGVTGTGSLALREPQRASLQLSLAYSRSEPCQLTVLRVEVGEVAGLGLAASGLAPFQSAAIVLAEWLLSSIESSFTELLKGKVFGILSETARSHQKSLCPILPK